MHSRRLNRVLLARAQVFILLFTKLKSMLQDRVIKSLSEQYESAPTVSIYYSVDFWVKIVNKSVKESLFMFLYLFQPREILFIRDMEARRWERQQIRGMNDFYNSHRCFDFDAFLIRWLFENRMGQEAHPNADWDHPAWSSPKGIISAYDAD